MSDKAEFVSGVLICVQRYRGNLELSRYNNLLLADNTSAYICATNSVSLWDYGRNKFNCITVSLQFML